ncbi:MAG: glycosyltransferase [Proteobacteria bacterium]|nr:glycosyltransferase [Pseudomonadota bacterium]
MSTPLISIVIVNWNGERFLKACLDSVYAQGFCAFEVVVLDNGSTDSSVEFIKEHYPEVILVEHPTNLGFAAGNNRAIEHASGKYILTLNNDTELSEGFLEALAASATDASSKVGMWAPKILSMKDRDVIDSVGGLLVYGDCLAKGRGRGEKDVGQYDSLEEVFFPSACAALYRKSMLDKIGLFDEDFFAYCEDTDLGLRARLAGFSALSVPGAKVYHYYSGTSGKYSPFKAYLVERNHNWAAIKSLPLSGVLAMPFYIKWRLLVQAYGVFAGRGAGGRFVEDFSAFKLLTILIKVYAGLIISLPELMSKRRRVKRIATVSDKEIRAWFKAFGITASELVLKD